jgi:hypothetical protein
MKTTSIKKNEIKCWETKLKKKKQKKTRKTTVEIMNIMCVYVSNWKWWS